MSRRIAREQTESPDFLSPFRHRLPLQLRFCDADRLGHVNNSVYQQFYDLGRLHYFMHVLGRPINWDGVGVVLARVEIDFYRPLHVEEHAAVATLVPGEFRTAKSFETLQAIYNPDSGLVYSIGQSVMVGFDPSTGHSTEILPEWWEAIDKWGRG